jgi:LysR family transcriptional regulator, transcriptional activator of the cysJI operon
VIGIPSKVWKEAAMTIKQFMIFATVSRHLNITRASQELHISQPSVSQHLKLLEEDYNVKLFKKSKRGIVLTGSGNLFLTKLMPILAQLDELKRAFVNESTESQVDSLVIGGTYGPSALLLPSLTGVFKRSYPRVELELRSANRPYMERLVLSSEVDLALVTGRPSSSNLVVEPYRKEKLLAFVARNHLLASKRELSLAQFARVPLIIHGRKNSSNTATGILRDLQGKGLEPVVAVRCESPDAVKTAVREKIGLGILYQDTVRRELGNGEFISVKVHGLKLEGESFIISHKDKPLSSAALAFLNLLRWWRTKHQGNGIGTGIALEKNIPLERELSLRHGGQMRPH